MAVHIYRVAVRGRFDHPGDESRAALVAAAGEHDVVTSGGFTDAGTLSYDDRIDFFTFRVQLRSSVDDGGTDEVTAEALRRATAAVAKFGATGRDVKVTVSDMADMWR